MTEPSASIWEVTQRILSDPDTDPAEIAAAYGYTMSEIAEMLPFVVENLQADFAAMAAAEGSEGPPTMAPGESPEEYAARWLTELRHNSGMDLLSYDSLASHDDVSDWLDAESPNEQLPTTTGATTVGDAASSNELFDTSVEFGAGGTAPAPGATEADSTDGVMLSDVDDELMTDPLESSAELDSAAPADEEADLDVAGDPDPGFD